MRKLLLAAALALSLAGCQNGGFLTQATNFATVGVANPVTKQDLYNFENTMIVAFAGLNAYKKACVAGAVDTNCRANIRAMQFYTRQLPPILASVRAFIKQNDRVNAATAFAEVKDLYNRFSTLAVANGVKVQ